MPDLRRDAFGRLLVDPDALPREERIEVLRRLAGELQAHETREARWLGRSLGRRLRDGGDLEAVLGLRPPRGSRSTPEEMARRADVDSGLAQLACALGVTRAARVLRGDEIAPDACAGLVEALRRQRAPTSKAAIVRARKGSRDRR